MKPHNSPGDLRFLTHWASRNAFSASYTNHADMLGTPCFASRNATPSTRPNKSQMRRGPLQRATLTHFLASHLFDKHADARMTCNLLLRTAFSRSKLNLRNRIHHVFYGSNCKSRLSSSCQAHWPRPLRPRVLSIRTAFR